MLKIIFFIFALVVSNCWGACGTEPAKVYSRTELYNKFGNTIYFYDCKNWGEFSHDCKRYFCDKSYRSRSYVRLTGRWCHDYSGSCQQVLGACKYDDNGRVISCVGK